MPEQIEWIECPRDAMQGWPHQIPTATKISYLNSLLEVGFDTLDFGSFVSPKAIPQMADTREVLAGLQLDDTDTKLLAIIANTRGAEEAAGHEAIHYLGFPFSISETFQQRNTNKSIVESLIQVKDIQQICSETGKELCIYISMGFGNPYGDHYDAAIATDWVKRLSDLGVRLFAMSDTVGVAEPELITAVFTTLNKSLPELNIGAHFHSAPHNWKEKIDAAYEAGCRRFDTAMKGIGGCPMAKDDLVGNMASENFLEWMRSKNLDHKVDEKAFGKSLQLASSVFI